MVNQTADVDVELVKEIAYEKETIPTDLSEELLIEKVIHLYPRLRYIASTRDTTTYEEVTEGFKLVSYPRIGAVLGVISTMEYQRGRPLITAVVKSASEEVASDGFFVLLENLGHEIPNDEQVREEIWYDHLEDVYDKWATRGRLDG